MNGPLPAAALLEAYRAALELIREKFLAGEPVPFSTPEACGQYNLHSAEAALELIELAPRRRAILADNSPRPSPRRTRPSCTSATCAWSSRGCRATSTSRCSTCSAATCSRSASRQRVNLTAGNFGCSTGEYLMVADPEGLSQEALLAQAHREVAATLAESGSYTGSNRSAAAPPWTRASASSTSRSTARPRCRAERRGSRSAGERPVRCVGCLCGVWVFAERP
jgi:S-ribosylhomocysteine lyase LuxS involved in autoinducer biosynthesis